MITLEKKAFTDGWRGRIGLVATAPGNATEADFNKYRPSGVAVLTTRTPLTDSTVEGIKKMNGYVEDAAVMLAKNAYADIILLSSTAGSIINGYEYDRMFSKRIEELTGAAVITSSSCLLKALKALGVNTVTLITPTSQSLNDAEKAFMNECGITVARSGGFLFSDPHDILCASPNDVYTLAKKSDGKDSEAVVISCSGLHVMEMIETLEGDLGKPVLTSNQFGLWGTLRTLGIKDHIKGIGKLFRV